MVIFTSVVLFDVPADLVGAARVETKVRHRIIPYGYMHIIMIQFFVVNFT